MDVLDQLEHVHVRDALVQVDLQVGAAHVVEVADRVEPVAVQEPLQLAPLLRRRDAGLYGGGWRG